MGLGVLLFQVSKQNRLELTQIATVHEAQDCVIRYLLMAQRDDGLSQVRDTVIDSTTNPQFARTFLLSQWLSFELGQAEERGLCVAGSVGLTFKSSAAFRP